MTKMKVKSIRNKYKKLFLKLKPLTQIIIIVIFALLFIISLVLLLPLTELGIPAILISLAVLSFKFKWAERSLSYFEKLFSNKLIRGIGLVIGVVGIIVFAIWWLR